MFEWQDELRTAVGHEEAALGEPGGQSRADAPRADDMNARDHLMWLQFRDPDTGRR